MKHWLVSIVLIFCCISFYAQKNADEIIWSKDYKLTWEDFKGKPKSSMDAGAITSSGISPNYKYEKGKIEFTIITIFNTKKSWVKETSKHIKALEHEQGHFDISEIYVRKFKKQLSETKFKSNPKKLKKQFYAIYDIIAKELDEYQDLYDKETNHHIKQEEQKRWNKKIAKELAELEEYATPETVVDLNKKSCKK